MVRLLRLYAPLSALVALWVSLSSHLLPVSTPVYTVK
jgi:hypothetical protein